MLLESIHELEKDLFLSLLFGSDIGMLSSVVFVLELNQTYLTVHVYIKGSISSFDKVLSKLVHFANDKSKKFVEVDFSTAIDVHGFEETLNVLWVEFNSKVIDCLSELVKIKSASTIVISYLELS